MTKKPGGSVQTSERWPTIDFDGDPRLIVGWRGARKRLDALRVRLDQNVFDELKQLCEPASDFLAVAREREYEQFAELEKHEEFFSYEISDLPKHPPARRAEVPEAKTPADDTADVVRLVRSVDSLDEIRRDEIGERNFSFYGICWPYLDSKVGFVSKSNPMASLHPGVRYFRYTNTLRRTEHPDLILTPGADIVVGFNHLAIIRSSAFTILLGDVGVAFERVPSDLMAVEKALANALPLGADAIAAIQDRAGRTLSYARRLATLPSRLAELPAINANLLRKSMRRHGVDPGLLLGRQGEFLFGPDEVGLFLDVLESRYFEDDLGTGLRRADRFSKR
jgi:hypothetical protein